MHKDLDGKVALITGGAAGIGRATALAFAREGAKLVIADIQEELGQTLVEELEAQGCEASFICADMAQESDVKAMVAHTVERFGRLDCAFNNAGIEGGSQARLADLEAEEFDRVIDVNLKGVWLCMKYEIQQMLTQEAGGSIVNMASVAGLIGSHSLSVYAASKHGVLGLTRSAAVEYGRKKIRSNAVCPGVTRTKMVERAFAVRPDIAASAIRVNPSRRIGEPEEVAEATVWLCSDAASYINGVALPIDGGFTAQ